MTGPEHQAMPASVNEWLAYMESLHTADIELGLERVMDVARRLDCLRPAPLVILVGGTNGKGTTTALLSALLARQGMRVGVYNSPHILRYNERVSVNGDDISDADLCASFAMVEAARGDTALTYFEYGTLAALAWFRSRQLDACVLEIGLGGRLDAVNIVDADLSIVTSIGLDHEAWLGGSVEQIAYEKCSIARAGRFLVCGQPNPPTRAEETVTALGGRFVARGRDYDITENADGSLELSFQPYADEKVRIDWRLPAANIPPANVATAIQALALLGHLLPEQQVAETVQRLRVAGRLQRWHHVSGLSLTLDVAHNEQAAAYLGSRGMAVDGIVLGMLGDKAVEQVVQVLPPVSRWKLAGLQGPRALDAGALRSRVEDGLRAAGRAPALESYDDVMAALGSLLDRGETGHWLVLGSFYTVEQALRFIRGSSPDEKDSAWTSI